MKSPVEILMKLNIGQSSQARVILDSLVKEPMSFEERTRRLAQVKMHHSFFYELQMEIDKLI